MTAKYYPKIILLTLLIISLLSSPVLALGGDKLNMEVSDIMIRANPFHGSGITLEPSIPYLFEGDQISFVVRVESPQDISDVKDVYLTLGSLTEVGNDKERDCRLNGIIDRTHADYSCVFIVSTAERIYGPYFVGVESEFTNGVIDYQKIGIWFFNPVTGLAIDGPFTVLASPGQRTYSEPIIVTNDADDGSNMPYFMYISGTDLYDSKNSNCKIPLSNIAYYSTNGRYNTKKDPRADSEGYVPIKYGDNLNRFFYNSHEILQGKPSPPTLYGPLNFKGNILQPNKFLTMVFRIDVPKDCSGKIDDGFIAIWVRNHGGGLGVPFSPEVIITETTNPIEINVSISKIARRRIATRLDLDIVLSKKVTLEYLDLGDALQGWKTLCTNCEGYKGNIILRGSNKNKLLLKATSVHDITNRIIKDISF